MSATQMSGEFQICYRYPSKNENSPNFVINEELNQKPIKWPRNSLLLSALITKNSGSPLMFLLQPNKLRIINEQFKRPLLKFTRLIR